MYAPKYRLEAIETIGRKILLEYDRTLLEGPPQAIPVETIIETKFNLTLEYHTLRKNGSVLGETIFDDGAAILYDRTERQYRLIAVKAGTILIDERLCIDRLLGRMRFTCAHELGHWVLHQKLYSGTGDVAAYDGKTSSDESCGFIERQADALATALLMPIPQVKKCFYRLRPGKSKECLVTEMARIFQVSKQAMRIRLEVHNLLSAWLSKALFLKRASGFHSIRKVFCYLVCSQLSEHGRRRKNAERECHCPKVQETDGLPWI